MLIFTNTLNNFMKTIHDFMTIQYLFYYHQKSSPLLQFLQFKTHIILSE